MWSAHGSAFKRRQRTRDSSHFVQAQAAGAAARIFFFFCAGPFRMTPRASPVNEPSFHDLRVGKNETQVDCHEDDNQRAMLMPQFQSCGGPNREKSVETRTNPFDGAAVVNKIIQAVEFLPGLFELGMADGRGDAHRAFNGGYVGAKALPEH